jgi:hypothetical protein
MSALDHASPASRWTTDVPEDERDGEVDPLRTSQLERYDQRYVFSAPDLKPISQRLE